jgi:hypothetical protein
LEQAKLAQQGEEVRMRRAEKVSAVKKDLTAEQLKAINDMQNDLNAIAKQPKTDEDTKVALIQGRLTQQGFDEAESAKIAESIVLEPGTFFGVNEAEPSTQVSKITTLAGKLKALSGGAKSSQPSQPVQQPASDLVKVINPQGKPVNIKRAQLNEALATGYKVAE